LWFTQGLHAFSRVETPHGLARLDQSGVWRLNPKTLQLDGFFNRAKAGHNCWGMAFDDYFQPFHKSGDRPHGYWSLPGLVRGVQVDEYHPLGALFKSDRKTTALDFIGTQALDATFQGTAVIGGFFGNTVELHRVLDDGAGFASEEFPKLVRSSDTSFRPVDVSVGPDGAIYVLDWCVRAIGHYQASYADPQRDRVHGRIWRLTRNDAKRLSPTVIANKSPSELLGLLESPERWVRDQAQRLLTDGDATAVVAAIQTRAKAPIQDERLVLALLAILQAHQQTSQPLLEQALKSADHRIRAYGYRTVGNMLPHLPSAVAWLKHGVHDSHPRVRLEAVVACSELGTLEAALVAVQAVDEPQDRFLKYAIAQSLRALQSTWEPALAQGMPALSDTQRTYLSAKLGAVEPPPHPGKIIYDNLCLACHQADGMGLPNLYPPLGKNSWVAGSPIPLIRVITHGLSGPITVDGQSYGVAVPIPMPPMGLTDQQAAEVLTYIRSHFGNSAGAVTAESVASERAQHPNRTQAWTAETVMAP
jgi:mono/diheme cytochrome c family protein